MTLTGHPGLVTTYRPGLYGNVESHATSDCRLEVEERIRSAAFAIRLALHDLNQSTSAALLLLAHPAKTECADVTVRGVGELSADLDVLWNIQTGKDGMREARCQKDRGPDLESARFQFSIEPWNTGTRLTRRYKVPQIDPAEVAILAAVKDSPSGLTRTHLQLVVRETCGFGRSKTFDTITRLKSAGTLREAAHHLFLTNQPQPTV
jgi:hypothetical protein